MLLLSIITTSAMATVTVTATASLTAATIATVTATATTGLSESNPTDSRNKPLHYLFYRMGMKTVKKGRSLQCSL